ncbi:MAG: hypothetical protein FJ284_12485, partial [Planctomycetes bacterium]|nr:hypothetical protein [Planctomycetota bacterium]
MDQPDELRFVRVNVPVGSLADVPLGGGRYIPMPTAEFEDAIARLGGPPGSFRTVSAVDVRYELTLDAEGRLAGTVEFELADPAARLPNQISLGRVAAGRCTIRTPAGTGDAAVFCMPDGTAAVRTTGPGRYSCDLRVPSTAIDAALHLPLMPALATTVDLELPEGMRPVLAGPAAATTVIESPAAGRPRWRLALGPTSVGQGIGLWIDGGRHGPPRVRAWNAIDIEGRQARVVTRLEPTAPWMSGTMEVTVSAGLVVDDVVAEASGEPILWALADARLTIHVPASLGGSTGRIVVSGVMPAAPGRLARVPLVEPSAARWSGCNTRLSLDPALAVQRVELDHCRAVSPATAAAWPVPVVRQAVTGTGIEPARIDLEHESPGGEVRMAFGPRDATLDVARATLVDISSGTVLGKTAVDVRVVAGQAFGIVADVAPGWIIDSVEAVDGALGRDSGTPGDPAERTLEWRVARSPRGSELRIGLSVAATPRRDLGLRITGHRSGLPLGSEFSSADMDMVRFAGETAVLEFQLGPTAVLEPIGDTLGVEPVPERLEKLVAIPPPRVRIRAGDRVPAIRARLLRRRPPVEAEVTIDLVARGDRLAENFNFTCRPVAGELDAVVIHFSTAMGSGLEWSTAAGDGTTLAAQPLEAGDAMRGELQSEATVAESWLVELRPATAAAVSFRAFRTVTLETESAVPLAWVEAAERPGGTVTVRGEPGRRPALFNHQLRELPAVAGADTTVVELAYGSPRSLVAGPVAEVAAPPAMAVPRAWAWKHETTVWCHESGGLEWEASFDVENEGRDAATVTLPRGMSVEGVTVADEAVTATPLGTDATVLTVPLTRGHGRIRVVIRGAVEGDGRTGWWRIGDVASSIDMPVLELQTMLMLPPGLDVASAWSPAAERGWPTRLFGA